MLNLLLLLLVAGVIVLMPVRAFSDPPHVVSQTESPSPAPIRRPLSVIGTDGWMLVYERFPDLPLENHYTSAETGNVAVNNTLASRLIRYHTIVKGRLPIYRFDWKLTLADYLGVNELMVRDTYPGWDTLETNPMEADVAIIRQMNRAQRDALVDALVSIFNTPTDPTLNPTPSNPPFSSTPTPSPRTTPSSPTVQPQPGAADLLLP